MKKTLLLGIGAMAFNAQAAVIVQTGTVINGPIPSAAFPKTTAFTFDQFDDMGGTRTLNSVTLTIDASASSKVDADNEGATAATFTAKLEGDVTGSIPSLTATVGLLNTPPSIPVTGDSEPGGAFADFAGSDHADFGTISDSDSASNSITMGLGAYIGLGTLNGSVLDENNWTVSGGGDAITRIRESQSLTDWTVTYDYSINAVPEPSSFLSLGLLFVGMMGLRRR